MYHMSGWWSFLRVLPAAFNWYQVCIGSFTDPWKSYQGSVSPRREEEVRGTSLRGRRSARKEVPADLGGVDTTRTTREVVDVSRRYGSSKLPNYLPTSWTVNDEGWNRRWLVITDRFPEVGLQYAGDNLLHDARIHARIPWSRVTHLWSHFSYISRSYLDRYHSSR